MKKINEVSKLVGVSKRTLQYYDDEGIVVVKRGENNHRVYDQIALEQIWRIMLYKEMGIDLKDIKKILSFPEEKQKEFLEQRMVILKKQVNEIEKQMEFILLVIEKGVPQLPKESAETTYKDILAELRKNF